MAVRGLWYGVYVARSVQPALVGTGLYNPWREASSGSEEKLKLDKKPLKKPKTPQGRFDETEESSAEKDPLERFPDNINPVTKERDGPRGPEPTRYGDWERKGRCIDF
ncbi:succinate dehydrogenase assembly factor 4, mitochondrial [Microcaecilia unicolor]|uniref:Succinate dehydrogenase assembly factor 4, mitochondrial n=1 Tax=Microcaecilia unicolor TaxID=1415580 RepID=A0A6P7XVZ7_9AMPH|nr:succinate dehydrogenase assembly factor 4, mitochondrial [Microcaecilia unicolor]